MTTTTAAPASVRPKRPSKARYVAVELAALVVLVLAFVFSRADWSLLANLPENLGTYVPLMLGGLVLNPFADPAAGYWITSLEAMLESIAMAWVGTVIGAILSLPIGFLAASNVAPVWVVQPVRQVLNAIRAIPDIVLAICVMVPVFGLTPMAGAVAIGVGSIGTLGKLTSEAVEGIQTGPVEAVRSSGANVLQVLRWGVLPQVLPEIVAFWLYRFEVNIRASAILGIVGAGGIGAYLSRVFDARDWDRIGIALAVIIVLTLIVDAISGAIRHRIIAGSGPRTRRRATRDEAAAVV